MLMWHQHQPLVSLPRKLERFQPDWNKTRPRPSLIVSCYPWISTPEGWLGVSSQDENALAPVRTPSPPSPAAPPPSIPASPCGSSLRVPPMHEMALCEGVVGV